MSTSPSISGTAIIRTGPITGPITDTGATITGRTGGIIQGTATRATGLTDATDIIGVTDITGVTGITGVTATSTVRGRPTLFISQQKRGQPEADPFITR